MVKTNVVIMSFFTYQSNIDIEYVHMSLIGIGLMLTFFMLAHSWYWTSIRNKANFCLEGFRNKANQYLEGFRNKANQYLEGFRNKAN